MNRERHLKFNQSTKLGFVIIGWVELSKSGGSKHQGRSRPPVLFLLNHRSLVHFGRRCEHLWKRRLTSRACARRINTFADAYRPTKPTFWDRVGKTKLSLHPIFFVTVSPKSIVLRQRSRFLCGTGVQS